MSMYQETVKTGAAAVRRSGSKDPMTLLARLREQDPTDSYERIMAKWKKQVERDAEYLDTALIYAGRNYWSALDRDDRVSRLPTKDQIQQRAERAQKAQAMAARVKLVLLDHVLSNGKQLRVCTGVECRREGGWLAKVGKLVGNRIVGDVLTEEKLRDLR